MLLPSANQISACDGAPHIIYRLPEKHLRQMIACCFEAGLSRAGLASNRRTLAKYSGSKPVVLQSSQTSAPRSREERSRKLDS